MTRRAVLKTLDLPEFGLPTVEPTIPANTYASRLEELARRGRQNGYDVIIVYGDREHSANLAYLTGYDPRFEEALLVLDTDRQIRQRPRLLVGNEGRGYARISPIWQDLDIILYQNFSLMGQSRAGSERLEPILEGAGITSGKRVAVAGWKYFEETDSNSPRTWLEIPSYIADSLRELTGATELVTNAGALLMHPVRGMRAINDVDQLARFEFAATYTSQAVRNVLFGLRPGMSEFEAARRLQMNGLPLSCHLMLSAGPRAVLGLASPSMRAIEHGDPFTVAYGTCGALNCRAGFVVHDARELSPDISDYIDRLVAPYFLAVAAWYEHVGIGVTGGELYDIIHSRLGSPFFGVNLNPGHLIHLDEWMHSPIYSDSEDKLQSGMAIQVDVIPATQTPYFTTNIEDGIALADEALRSEMAERYPEAWSRIMARRGFMSRYLGIRLEPEVLPFSNIPAYLAPFLLAPERAMCLAGE